VSFSSNPSLCPGAGDGDHRPHDSGHEPKKRYDFIDERDMLEAFAKLDACRPKTSASINQKVYWNAFQTKRGWQKVS
jgi:hypothetical protein